MRFNDFKLGQFKEINEILQTQNLLLSDYSCGAFYMWAVRMGAKYCIEDDTLFVRSFNLKNNIYYYHCPIGKLRLKESIEKIKKETPGFSLISFPSSKLEELSTYYKTEYEFDRRWSDYLYDAKAFAAFSGKKYHSKRNHISQFKRLYGEPKLEPLTIDLLQPTIDFLDHYHKKGEVSEMAAYELKKVYEILPKLDELNLFGSALKVNNRVIALTIGEIIGKMLIIHVEKALTEYEGAYTVISNLFVKQNLDKIDYVNREDDVGDEGLRKSKMSYNPLRLEHKYMVKIF